MPLTGGNLLADLPATALPEEELTLLLAAPGLRLERIVSTGQASPPGFWYDQPQAEWVLLLAGAAGLLIEGEPAPRRLVPGDHLLIPAHVRHRVAWTDPVLPTVWLAAHLGAG
ncbi:MAG: cupin domain-containing protein [Geminicoccaceae bacterium]